jgi:hypothetical protein
MWCLECDDVRAKFHKNSYIGSKVISEEMQEHKSDDTVCLKHL